MLTSPTIRWITRQWKERRPVSTLKPLPKLKSEVSNKGALAVAFDHPDEAVAVWLAMNALGVTRINDFNALLKDVGNIVSEKGKIDDGAFNDALAMIAGIGPRDTVEALLASQLLAVHHATMTAARHLKGSDTITQQDSNGTLLNKLMRTFTTQVETLKKYRSTGQQKMTVEHINVFPGGQAAVGVFTGG